jgi:molybdenum cofactor cytidylyltransferase
MLAAGQSSRMGGENKLTKNFNGIPLIKYAIKNILGSSINELIIVLGYEKEILEETIGNHKKIKFVYNENFKDGMASSIKIGLNHISQKSEAFFISLGDMPMINQNIYNKLIKSRYKYNKNLRPDLKKEIFVPTYEGKESNPVLFSIFMKNNIMSISGDVGAKEVLELNKDKILNVDIKNKNITIDFDTKDSFDSLKL